jgi:hypothetical protein
MRYADKLREAEFAVKVADKVWGSMRREVALKERQRQFDRTKIDTNKTVWRLRVAEENGPVFKSDRVTRIISEVLHNHLKTNRRDPWASPVICAIYEFAEEENALAVLNGVWNQIEVRLGFKCTRTEMPVELVGKAAMRA